MCVCVRECMRSEYFIELYNQSERTEETDEVISSCETCGSAGSCTKVVVFSVKMAVAKCVERWHKRDEKITTETVSKRDRSESKKERCSVK